jgi:hypothetical protein
MNSWHFGSGSKKKRLQTRSRRGAQMAKMADSGKKGNYDCEILSLIVLSILSALSHFWYILFAIYAGIIFWGAAVLLGHFLTSAARTFPLYGKRMLIKIPSRNHEPN